MTLRITPLLLVGAMLVASLGCEAPEQGETPGGATPGDGGPTPVSPPPDIGPGGSFVPPVTSPELPEPS